MKKAGGDEAGGNARDTQMAKNFLWLATVKYRSGR